MYGAFFSPISLSVAVGGVMSCTGWNVFATSGSAIAVFCDAIENSASSGDWLPLNTASFCRGVLHAA